MDINKKIRNYIEDNLIVFEDNIAFKDEDNIFEKGFVNSLFAMKLLNFIESEFKIVILNEEMDMDNFSSVDSISNFIKGKNGCCNEGSR